jgi:hypothetical protein
MAAAGNAASGHGAGAGDGASPRPASSAAGLSPGQRMVRGGGAENVLRILRLEYQMLEAAGPAASGGEEG